MNEVKEQSKAYKTRGDYAYIVKLWPFKHKGKDNIGIRPSVHGNPYLIVKGLGAFYTKTHRCYYLANTPSNLNKIFEAFKDKAWVDMTQLQTKKINAGLTNELKKRPTIKLNTTHAHELEKFYNYMRARRLATSTIKTYGNMVYTFLAYFNNLAASNIDDEMVKKFLAEDVKSRGYSNSYQRQMISAIKLFYKERLDYKLEIDRLPNIKKESKLPKVLSMNEVKNIIEATINIKHKSLLSICYACGLRIGEALNLKLANVNSERMVIEIIGAKGGKDRIIPISQSILLQLRAYYKAYNPSVYLFEGVKTGTPYTSVSANNVLKASAKRAGIKKSVHMHMLRHSYATHLLENGVDTRYIQKLLGHKSSKTTEIYTFVSNEKLDNITSPFDRLGLDDK